MTEKILVEDKQSETKFPDAVYAAERKIYKCEFYKDKDVLDWFKRCMEDYPKLSISRYPTPEKTCGELLDFSIEEKTWFNDWFGQFKEDKTR